MIKQWLSMVLYCKWERFCLQLIQPRRMLQLYKGTRSAPCLSPPHPKYACILQSRLFWYSINLLSAAFSCLHRSFWCQYHSLCSHKGSAVAVQAWWKESFKASPKSFKASPSVSGEKYFLESLGIWAMLGCTDCSLTNQQRSTGQKSRLELPSSSHS